MIETTTATTKKGKQGVFIKSKMILNEIMKNIQLIKKIGKGNNRWDKQKADYRCEPDYMNNSIKRK